ncbi:MAG: hypothetical protein FWC82_01105 [Firmicutes bacterium]|nr:hypothetical protein [Bacillota bacterium]
MNNKEKGIAIKLSSLEHNVLPMPRLYGGWTVRTLSANMKYIELALESLLFDYGFRPIIIEVQTGFTPKTSEILYHQLDNFFCQIEFLKNDLRNKKISIGNLLTSENMKEYVTLTWTDSDALGSAPDDGKHISIDTPLREIMDIVEEEILEYTKPDENISNLSENKKEIEPTIFTYLQGHLGWFPMDIYPSKIVDKKVSWVFFGHLEE